MVPKFMFITILVLGISIQASERCVEEVPANLNMAKANTIFVSNFGMTPKSACATPTAAALAAPAPSPAEAQAQQTIGMEPEISKAITFDLNSYTLSAQAQSELKKLAEQIRSENIKAIVVDGHTDLTGSDEINQPLSEKRAEAVKKAMAQFGVNPTMIKSRGLGSKDPIPGDNDASRRAVISIE